MSQRKPNITARYVGLCAAFAVICIAFLVALAVIQIKGPTTEYNPDGDNARRISVAGLRGEIYDRNGKIIVGNSTSYDLLYEYGAMPSDAKDVNAELLCVLKSLESTSESQKLVKGYFPLTGTYPEVAYSAAISNTSSEEYAALMRVFKRRNLKEDTTAEELANYYVKHFKLSDEIYTPEEIFSLMRIWYEMDCVDFGEYQPSYTLASDVSDELVALIEEQKIMGATFKATTERVYYYPEVASHILGRVGKITAENAEYYSELGYSMDSYVGISGCEYAFESILHGQDGVLLIKYDQNGNVTEKYYEKEPISGNDIYLTIDIDLQIAAEEGLEYAAGLVSGSRGGALTAIDPNSGAALAIASYPTYDLSKFSDAAYYNSLLADENSPLYNRALSGVYAPGSTYKIGVALAALEAGETSTSDICYCDGVYDGLDNPKCNSVHGYVDIFTAIQESCNIFFYNLGYDMGINSITAYTTRLGLGAPTGIELGDRDGLVASPEYRQENNLNAWGKRDDVSAAIGQSDHGYTPLQLSIYMASIVNGGTRYNAHVLDSVRHFYTGEILSSYEVTVADAVSFSSNTYDVLIESMGRVVSQNPEVAQYFKNVSVAVGGKTGTAEVAGQADNALFCGFAPLNNPQIVVSCIIEEGQHGYFASAAVAKVMEQYFDNQ